MSPCAARAGPDDDGDDERDRHLAQAAERLDEDARGVHAPRRAQRIGDDRGGPVHLERTSGSSARSAIRSRWRRRRRPRGGRDLGRPGRRMERDGREAEVARHGRAARVDVLDAASGRGCAAIDDAVTQVDLVLADLEAEPGHPQPGDDGRGDDHRDDRHAGDHEPEGPAEDGEREGDDDRGERHGRHEHLDEEQPDGLRCEQARGL